MANDFDQTGVIQVNGAWATSVKYAADALGPDTGRVELRFMQGRTEVGRAAISRENLSELLGEKNRSAIERHIANDADKYLAVVSGELRGRRLHYQAVALTSTEASKPENSISPAAARERDANEENLANRETPTDAAGKVGAAPNADTDPRDAEEEKRRRASQARVAAASGTAAAVPAHIAAKYLIKGNTYHFDDQTVAFIDKGTSLTVQTHNKAIVKDLVAIAQARNWQAVTVSGSEAFRREAWSAASAAGLAVRGYTPSALETMAAERTRARRDDPERASALAQSPRTELKDQPVTPPSSEKPAVSATKDGSSSELGARKLTRDQEAAAAIRSAAITREELQLKYPELNQAVFQHFASHDQFADAYVKSGLIREADRAQVIAQMRDRLAVKLEQGVTIREPDDKEVNTLIRRSVNRVAADIGRPPTEIQARTPEAAARTGVTREDAQVRA
jgi:hypothetical protein